MYMKYDEHLLIVGTKNEICAQILNTSEDNQLIEKSILSIGGDVNSLVHSVLIEDNILYIIDSYHDVLLKYSIKDQSLLECYTGRDPRHLCIDKSNVYVTNFESDNIAVVDKISLELQETIPAGIKPHDVKVDGDYNTILISCYDEKRLLKYNTRTGVKSYYNTEGMPMHFVIDNNIAYILTYCTNGVVKTMLNILDLDEGMVERTYQLEGMSTIIDYDENSKEIYILNIETESLHIIDIENMQEIKKIYLGGYPEDISIGRDNIYIVNSSKKLLTIIDKAHLQVKMNVNLDYTPQCITVF